MDRTGLAGRAFDALNHWFTMAEVIIVGSDYWNLGFGRTTGEVNQDEEGLASMAVLGQNMAWVLKKYDK